MPRITQSEYEAYQRKRMAPPPPPASSPEPCSAGREVEILHAHVIAECDRRGWRYSYNRPDKPTTIPGVPDFIILADGGRVIQIECKTEDGNVTLDQAQWMSDAERLGHRVFVCRSVAQIEEVMG